MSESNARVQRTTGQHTEADHDVGVVTVVHRHTNHRHRIDSGYVQAEWLPIIGPTAYLLAGQLAHTERTEARISELGAAIGVGGFRWRQALARLHRFGLVTMRAEGDALIVTLLIHWPDAPSRR